MAIFKPGSDYHAPVVVGGVMLAPGAQAQPVATTATNNRSRSKRITYRQGVAELDPTSTPSNANASGFAQLDNRILQLDAAFDALPDKSPWVVYAANIAGEWQLCANCQPDTAAKKLYRQYNFNRALRGLAPTAAPVDLSEFWPGNTLTLEYFTVPGQPQPLVFIVPTTNPSTDFVTAQLGLAMANPTLDLSLVTAGTFYSSGPVFDWGKQVAEAVATPDGPVSGAVLCGQNESGAPGLKGGCLVEWFAS